MKVSGLQKSVENEHLWSYCVHVLGISGIGLYINVYEIRVQEERKMFLFVWENINYYFNIILL